LKECLVRPCCLELAQFYPASIQAGHFWRNRDHGAWPFRKGELKGIADIHQCGGAKNRQLSAATLHQASRHQRPAVDQHEEYQLERQRLVRVCFGAYYGVA